MKLYAWIDAQKATFPVSLLCGVLSVPESSYYDWNHHGRQLAAERDEREAVLVGEIRRFHDASTGTYGSPRIHADLVEAGWVVSERHVAELMAQHAIIGLSGREHSTVTTRRDRLEAPFPDLVGRRFHPDAPDVVWYGDVTYIWVADRFWYLATVIDGHSKSVVGWAFADHMRTDLVTDALSRAIARRGGTVPVGLIFHSDRGSQYTSHAYGELCTSWGIAQSMGRRGTCFDNAAAESFFATLKRELIDRYRWKSANQVHHALFVWIETWYNRRRRHSTLGYKTPATVEAEYKQYQQAS